MAILVAVIIVIVAMVIAYQSSRGKSQKRKFIVWGLTTMVAIAPFLSWLVSIGYANIEGSGWAGVALLSIMFPLLFLFGLAILLVGIFKKKD